LHPYRHQELLHEVTLELGGNMLGISDFNEGDKKQLIRRNLIEESIASSKLEGANTSREAARRMLSEGRKPRDKSEIMIANNHATMSVGRLDVNSEGLLVLSSDGPLAQAMMSPASALPRVYRVRVRGRLSEKQIAELRHGVTIEGINYRGAEFVEEADLGGRTNAWYRVTLREGKNREIRKLFEYFGCMVNRLIRVQYGPFLLGELKTGEVKEVSPVLVQKLLEELGRGKVEV
jgi:pseudouridine synthase